VEDGGRKRGERRGCHRPIIYDAAAVEGTSDRNKLIGLAVFALVAVGIAAAVLIASGGDDGDNSTTVASAGGCERVEAPKPKRVSFEAVERTVKEGEGLTAVVDTSCGSFEIALDSKRAPRTVESFAFLAEKGFYDGLAFHRIIPGFVVQGGDPLGTGSGGPGYSVDEKPPANLAYTKGVVAMAKSEAEPPGRSGSQFFVVVGADAGLTPDYALVGVVDEGMGVVERIGRLGTSSGVPKQTVLIEQISIQKG
jgi:peptidyl-prolyl cis-trans isomerase B (cyclophilin B)